MNFSALLGKKIGMKLDMTKNKLDLEGIAKSLQ